MKEARILTAESSDLVEIFSEYEPLNNDPSLILALRRALFDEVTTGNSPPTVWIHNSYGRNGMVTIGRNERPTRVNFETCRKLGVPVYVRTSGGWHIYNDSSYVFINAFIPSSDAEEFGIIKRNSDSSIAVVRSFEFNSQLTSRALNIAGVEGVYMHPGDPSSIMVDQNLIAINSAYNGGRAIYLEGGIRCMDTDIEKSGHVLKMNEQEKRDLLLRNTSVSKYNPDISIDRLKEIVAGVYKTGIGTGTYSWHASRPTEKEIRRAVEYAGEQKSLTELSDSELEKIGQHDGKLCMVHWLEKYGPYVPGAH